jgi:phosphoribosyl-ATP pyrophosphohydrolase/phosphoribosyl-AMP cyclohydrolase
MSEPQTFEPRTFDPTALRYDARGLVPVVVQDVSSGAVLMLAYADGEALERTRETGQAHFWSRSRQALWQKGETSGNTLAVEEMLVDCDGDAVLYRALPQGPTCHRLTRSCFEPNSARLELGWLEEVLRERAGSDPEASYTARLLAAGVPKVAQKVGEEATETVIAALSGVGGHGEGTDPLVSEAADLLYHLLVLLRAREVSVAAVAEELQRRHRSRPSGGRRGEEKPS